MRLNGIGPTFQHSLPASHLSMWNRLSLRVSLMTSTIPQWDYFWFVWQFPPAFQYQISRTLSVRQGNLLHRLPGIDTSSQFAILESEC